MLGRLRIRHGLLYVMISVELFFESEVILSLSLVRAFNAHCSELLEVDRQIKAVGMRGGRMFDERTRRWCFLSIISESDVHDHSWIVEDDERRDAVLLSRHIFSCVLCAS